jgi:hypothetical protein
VFGIGSSDKITLSSELRIFLTIICALTYSAGNLIVFRQHKSLTEYRLIKKNMEDILNLQKSISDYLNG